MSEIDVPISAEQAQRFAHEWVSAWNAHDLPRILSHYTLDFSMTSPFIVQIAGDSSGTLQGQEAVGAYWRQALERMPDLQFELIGVYRSMRSVAIHYRNQAHRFGVEVFHFDPQGKIHTAVAHYV